MLEVSARRIASALFLCLVICEDHVANLEKTKANEIEEQIRKEKKILIEMQMQLEKNKVNDEVQLGSLEEIIIEPELQVESLEDRTLQKDEGKDVEKIIVSTIDRTYSGGILFHCAQGKDRTGILAMLLTFSLYGDSPAVEEKAAREYGVSEELLVLGREKMAVRERAEERERRKKMKMYNDSDSDSDNDSDSVYIDDNDDNGDSDSDRNRNSVSNSVINRGTSTVVTDQLLEEDINESKKKKKNSNENKNKNLGEIQSLKGSPPQALKDTLARVRIKYGGSILGYLDHIGFTKDYRKRLQITAEKTAKLQLKL